MSIKSRKKQIEQADISGNWTGMVGYKKANRKKLPIRRFRSGYLGTVKGEW